MKDFTSKAFRDLTRVVSCVQGTVESQHAFHYWQGVEDGMRRFAWWKDGAQQVGTTGTTLMKALCDMDKASGIPCPHAVFSFPDDTGYERCKRCGIVKGVTVPAPTP